MKKWPIITQDTKKEIRLELNSRNRFNNDECILIICTAYTNNKTQRFTTNTCSISEANSISPSVFIPLTSPLPLFSSPIFNCPSPFLLLLTLEHFPPELMTYWPKVLHESSVLKLLFYQKNRGNKCDAGSRANIISMPFSNLTIDIFFMCLYLFRNSAAPKYPPATRSVKWYCWNCVYADKVARLYFGAYFWIEIDTLVVSFQLTYYSNKNNECSICRL